MILMHGDDKGLVLPPAVAPEQIIIVPITPGDTKKNVMKEVENLAKQLKNFRVHIDDRDGYSPGFKFSHWELKGVPLRIEIGPKDLEKIPGVFSAISNELAANQISIIDALICANEHIIVVDEKEVLKAFEVLYNAG